MRIDEDERSVFVRFDGLRRAGRIFDFARREEARNARQVVVTRLEWDVDGMPVRSPVGEFGSRLTAAVELLLLDGTELYS